MQTNFLPRPAIRDGFFGIGHHGHGSRRLFRAAQGKGASGGFSLIEVVLALGVVAFAFVALFGMLPVGLNAFNNSIDSTTEVQIAQNVMSQLKQAKFSQLYATFNNSSSTTPVQPSFFKPYNQAYTAPTIGFYYDDQDNFLGFVQQTGTLTTPPANWAYAAGVQVYYDGWSVSGGAAIAPPYGVQPENTAVASGSVSPTTPQPFATVIITVVKESSPYVARIYTGYIDNNGL